MAPLSDQELKVYCVAMTVCGEVVAMVCWVPSVQVCVCAVVYAVPSMLKDSPAGLAPTVT